MMAFTFNLIGAMLMIICIISIIHPLFTDCNELAFTTALLFWIFLALGSYYSINYPEEWDYCIPYEEYQKTLIENDELRLEQKDK